MEKVSKKYWPLIGGRVMLNAVGSDPGEWEGTYIIFTQSDPENLKKRKTGAWDVIAKTGGTLGQILWFARWRKYGFFPAPDCVFETVCLGDIVAFLNWATDAHKNGI
jgi:hypothetical protein